MIDKEKVSVEEVEVVGAAILGGIFHGGSGPELGDIDVELNTDVLERIQYELVDSSDDVMISLMTVAQHQRITDALRGEVERKQREIDLLWSDRRKDAALIAELRAQLAQQQVPGWKLVPVEPTPEMANASVYNGTDYTGSFDFDDFKKDWTDILAATPAPVQAHQQVADGGKPRKMCMNGDTCGNHCSDDEEFHRCPIARQVTLPKIPTEKMLSAYRNHASHWMSLDGWRAMLEVAPCAPAPVAEPASLSAAARDVLAERQRQISAEGLTPEHDDEHGDGSMALAASCYACASAGFADAAMDWPWSDDWFKPSSPRRDLIKAGALILAEIERLDRAAAPSAEGCE